MQLLNHAKARFDYQFSDTYTAGIVLTGQEVKSLRGKHGSLSGTFVRLLGHEAFLVNAQIPLYKYAQDPDYDPRRMRKLLLKKRELLKLEQLSLQKGVSLVPISIDAVANKIKLTFGVGKGRTKGDKRAVIRKRELDREDAKLLRRPR